MAIHYLAQTDPARIKGVALLRLDFNTKDDWRMKAVMPTMRLLIKHSSKIVVVSHRGRPEGIRLVRGVPRGFKKDQSLRRDAVELARLVRRPVVFVPHFRFANIRSTIRRAPAGSIFLLENLRFLPGEEKNDSKLARALASLADFYVNDAFAVSHRANASVVPVTKYLPSYAGVELQSEIESLSRVMIKPGRPLVLILGGAKAADKLGVIKFFRKRADWFLLGGGPANSILWLRGLDVKKSVRDTESKDLKELRELSRYRNVVLPSDFHWHKDMIWDLGPLTIKAFERKIAGAGTVIWSGPLGFFEKKAYAKGCVAIARAVGRNSRAFSVAGGGETVMFLKEYGLDKKFSFISTGGGAMVDFLAGEKLPGIEALR